MKQPVVDNSIAGQIAAAQKIASSKETELIDQGTRVENAAARASMGNIGGSFRATSAVDFAKQDFQRSQENKDLQAIKQRAIDDPWSFYRGAAADTLAKSSTNDPSAFFQSKLEQMSSGKFDSSDPSYQWRFEQGQQALERSQASKGLLGSGNAAIELQQYGQGAASQEYQAQFSRMLQSMQGVESVYNTQQTRLMELAGVQTPGVQSGISAGIKQSQIGAEANVASAGISASASNYRTAEEGRQFNVEQQNNQQYQAGLGKALSTAGWGD